MWLGQNTGEPTRDFVYLIVDEGVGVGVVVNGSPMRGRDFTAGEFGHIPLDLNGPPCSCGGRGCFEAFTSDSATLKGYAESRKQVHPGEDLEADLSVEELVERARRGDAAARKAVEETGRYLGVGMAAIINSLNPGRIVVGGGITAGWEMVEPRARTEIDERTLTASAARTPISVDASYAETRLRGAVALVVAPAFSAPQVA
jgi:N-acetylglucosamine repressor